MQSEIRRETSRLRHRAYVLCSNDVIKISIQIFLQTKYTIFDRQNSSYD